MENTIHELPDGVFVNPQGRELTRHGTPLFPIGFYLDDLERFRVPWHWHDEMEMALVTRGETEVDAGTGHFRLSAGQGFFINAGVPHAMRGVPGTRCSYHSIVFHPRLVAGGTDSVYWQKYVRPLTANRAMGSLMLTGSDAWHAPILSGIDEVWLQCAKAEPGYEFRVRSALSQVVLTLTEFMPAGGDRESEKDRRDGERLKQMLSYLHDHLEDVITVEDLARSASISQSECQRCFRATVGLSPLNYVREYRVSHACELLTSTAKKLEDISAECGFQDVSYFIRTFRALRGATPAQYRRRERPESSPE